MEATRFVITALGIGDAARGETFRGDTALQARGEAARGVPGAGPAGAQAWGFLGEGARGETAPDFRGVAGAEGTCELSGATGARSDAARQRADGICIAPDGCEHQPDAPWPWAWEDVTGARSDAARHDAGAAQSGCGAETPLLIDLASNGLSGKAQLAGGAH